MYYITYYYLQRNCYIYKHYILICYIYKHYILLFANMYIYI